jgi:hypothetical protein
LAAQRFWVAYDLIFGGSRLDVENDYIFDDINKPSKILGVTEKRSIFCSGIMASCPAAYSRMFCSLQKNCRDGKINHHGNLDQVMWRAGSLV